MKTGEVCESIVKIVPASPSKRLGQKEEANGTYEVLKTPDWMTLAVQKGSQESCMKRIGEFLLEVIKEYVTFRLAHSLSFSRLIVVDRNPTSFRIFSPDELVSNKLDAVLDYTGRNFQWDVASRANGGRVIEILSEHTCQGMMQGYTLTGRTGLFPSYEAFLGIIHTMMVQYSKFVKMVRRD